MNPKYPVYIISKGRWFKHQTAKALDEMKVPYYIVVEPQEFINYAYFIPKEKILKLPFSNLRQGSIPARNWVWEHSIATGAERHWILDDNIGEFLRYNNNRRTKVTSGAIFKASEDFVDRYENVALAGFNYRFFVVAESRFRPPVQFNTRIYSCILIKNSLPYRWRGKYNEDTDLSLRVLEDGWCTVLFNAFLINKMATMTQKGGNTTELYRDNGRLLMAQSLVEQHPDVAVVTTKYNRPQHHVDYRIFMRNKLIQKQNISIPEGINNYGMKLIKIGDKKS